MKGGYSLIFHELFKTLFSGENSLEHKSILDLVQNLMENTNDGIAVTELDGKVLMVNKAFEELHGWNREEVIGSTLSWIPHHLVDELKHITNLILSGGRVTKHETMRLRKDGSYVFITLTVFPIVNPEGDVKALVYVENELQDNNNELYRRLVELSPESIIICTDYQIVYANSAAADLIGATRPEELVGRHVVEFLHSDYIKDLLVQVEGLSQSSVPSDIIQKKFIRMDKQVINVEVRAIASHYLGEPSVQLWCRNITDLTKAENNLMEIENIYKSLVDNAQIGVYLYQEGQVIYVNPCLAKLFGYSVEEFMLQKKRDLVVVEDWIKLKEEVRRVLTNQDSKHFFEIRGIRKDQKTIDLEGTISFITYNGNPAVFVTCQDITYKKEVEQLILDSAQRHHRLVKFLPEPIIVSNNGFIIYANKLAVELVKVKNVTELIGRSVFEFLHPDDHNNSKRTIQNVMESDEPSGFQECKLIGKNGAIINVEINSIRIHNFHGETVILSVLRDLTEQKKEEYSMIRSEKLAAVGKLAAGMAHEIRNPLTPLRGFCQILREKYKGDRYYFDIMLTELDRINMIVSDFMTLSKPQITEFKKKNINNILQSVISILETQATLNNVSIVSTYDELPSIYCEESQLKQVFVNVINNAIHAMPSGGEIKVSTKMKLNGYILASIQDEGIGIPEDIIQRVGEPFFTTKENGNGLGLMISRKIIENHHGLFKISSKQKQGTTIDIYLPIPNADNGIKG
jgi:PAS domain S-box-containing protein